ncbi:SH3 domain-containing protein [Ruminococcus flavefaciens]|uniref:SH3 domain-containing protein n=1 Tax=Ruminococcus flavefaciens TaxID=1265 RepID=A0A1H6ISJ6_RUMFL|nr:SH3 domain-containing protein [Ruminococcus flavefaciens]SEH50671.1 SH3 domain-containing protein [Ruminococcus flavefaciens]
MFMTNYELIYGEYKVTSSNSSSPVHKDQPTPTKEKGKGAETAVKAAKAVVGAHIAAAKFAGGAVSKLSKKAVDYAKSDDAAEKATLAKEKAGAAFAGLKRKVTGFTVEHKDDDNSDTSVDDVIEDENNVMEEAYFETEADNNVEEAAESASFDTLYEKAMNAAANEEVYDEETGYEAETPAAAPSVNTAPSTPTAPQPSPTLFSYEEEKKSPAIIVLVGVIAVLLVGMGILGGMLLTKNKDNKNSDKSSNNEVITTTTEEIASQATTASAQETTSEILTTNQNTTTKASVKISKEEIETAKDKAVSDLKNDLSDVYSNNFMNIPQLNVTTDYDINDDDIPELIVSYMGISGDTQYHIFYYDSSMFVKLKDCWGGLDISEERHLICEKHYGGGQGSYYYELSNDYKFNKIDEISTFPEQGGTGYFRNGQRIDTSEYYAAINYYNDMNWISISSDTSNVSDSGYIVESEKNSNALSLYSNYANIENAPADMTFVDPSDINAIPHGTINTETSGLNLRKGPGTTYDIILEIPKGEMVYVYGSTSAWCYVGFSSGTGRFNHTDYGYVSKEFLDIN